MPDKAIEQEIQAKGKTAPRITPNHIESVIASEHYFTAADGVAGASDHTAIAPHQPLELLTFCVLVLKNGFTHRKTSTPRLAARSPEPMR